MLFNSVLIPCSVIDIQTDLTTKLTVFRRTLKTGKALNQKIYSLGLNGCDNKIDEVLKLFVSKGILRSLRTIDIHKVERIVRIDNIFQLISRGMQPEAPRKHADAKHGGYQFHYKVIFRRKIEFHSILLTVNPNIWVRHQIIMDTM